MLLLLIKIAYLLFNVISHDFFVGITHGEFVEHFEGAKNPGPVIGEDPFTHACHEAPACVVGVRVPQDNLLADVAQRIKGLDGQPTEPRTDAQHQKSAHQTNNEK